MLIIIVKNPETAFHRVNYPIIFILNLTAFCYGHHSEVLTLGVPDENGLEENYSNAPVFPSIDQQRLQHWNILKGRQ